MIWAVLIIGVVIFIMIRIFISMHIRSKREENLEKSKEYLKNAIEKFKDDMSDIE